MSFLGINWGAQKPPQQSPLDYSFTPTDPSSMDFGTIAGYGQFAPVQTPSIPVSAYPGKVPTSSLSAGWNLDTAKIGLSGLQTLGNLYSMFEQNSLAKQQLAYAKEIGNANLNNQIKSYNTNLGDRANMDAVVGSWTPEKLAQYVDANKLSR